MGEFISKYTRMYESPNVRKKDSISGFIPKFTNEYCDCDNSINIHGKTPNPNCINITYKEEEV